MKANRHRIPFILLLIFLVQCCVSCATYPIRSEQITNISVIDLGTLPHGRNSTASDINDGGYIVGSSDTSNSGDRRAFVIDGSGIRNLGTLPGGGESRAEGISNNGYVVGYANVGTSSNGHIVIRHAFIERYNIMHDLGAYPPNDNLGSSSRAYAVNNETLIAGTVNLEGVVWDLRGTPVFPPFPPTTIVTGPAHFKPAVSYDINHNGQVVGKLLDEAIAFRWLSGMLQRLRTLNTPDLTDDSAYGINDRGQVVGKALLGPPARYHAVLWTNPGTIRDLGTLGGTNSSAQDINDSGTVVGYSETATGETHAFIWRPLLGMKYLGSIGGRNSKAFAINSHGVIVGESETASGEMHATRWKVTIETRIITRDQAHGESIGG